jgi:hypothetical protein
VTLDTIRLRSRYGALAACTFFVCAGAAFIPRLGIQNDEALFAQDNYPPHGNLYTIMLGHTHFRPMLMSYLGTLKSWLYRPILSQFGTGVWAVRLPMLLAAAASIWLFYCLLLRIAGVRAAWIGCGLLAADSLFLLTSCFDWGPVALQHLLLTGGLLLAVRFHQTRHLWPLGLAFFLFGLALWDKALAIWMLSGVAVAALVTIPRQILGAFTWKRVGIALAGSLLGAWPLIVYNVNNGYETFGSNLSYDLHDIPGKFHLLTLTANGHGLFSWLNDENWQTPAPHAPRGAVEAVSAKISAIARHPRESLFVYAFLLALVLAPLARGPALRAILFALIAMAVSWIQMAITRNAGGTVHHSILLWPMPAMAIAVSWAAASRRLGRAGIPAVAAALAVTIVSGILVTNEYFAVTVRNGGGPNWTDAVFRLSDYMRQARPANVYCMDWGILDSLRLLNAGTLPLNVGMENIGKAEMNQEDREAVARMIAWPGAVFLAHTKDAAFFPEVNEKLLRFAGECGYREERLAMIADSYGRETYEVYRLVK